MIVRDHSNQVSLKINPDWENHPFGNDSIRQTQPVDKYYCIDHGLNPRQLTYPCGQQYKKLNHTHIKFNFE